MRTTSINFSVLKLFFFAILLQAFLLISSPVKAANYYIRWEFGGSEYDIVMEDKEKLFLGDYVKITYGKEYYTGSMVKAKYASKKKSIATINKNGLVTTKKPGSCDLTFSYKGQTLTAHLTVVATGGLGLEKEYTNAVSKLKEYASKLTIPTKVTSSNAAALYSSVSAYRAGYNLYSPRYLTDDGTAYLKRRIYTDTGVKDISSFLAVPPAGRYLTANALLNQFKYKNDPFESPTAKNLFKVSKATASTTGITVTLKKAPTDAQILAIKLKYQKLNPASSAATEAKMVIPVYSYATKKYYNGNAVFKKGATAVTIQLSEKSDKYNKPISLTLKSKYEFRLQKDKLSTVTVK